MAQLNANLSEYDTQESFDVLPPGEYAAQVVDSEIKEGAKGPYINWTFQVAGKPNKIWDVMSLGNEVSMKRLKTLATCAGHVNPNYIADTEELHGKAIVLKLKVETDETGQYAPKNKVAGFRSLKKAPATVPPPHVVDTPQPQTPPKMPWE